jgi:hypothetical protein
MKLSISSKKSQSFGETIHLQAMIQSLGKSLQVGLENVLNSLAKNFVTTGELQVWHEVSPTGEIVWSAYHPDENQGIYQVSEEDVRRWIERRHSA